MKTLVSQDSPHLHLAISHSKRFWTLLAVTLAMILVLLFPRRAFGSEQVIYTLTGGADGSGPTGLVENEAGNLYGTAFSGGSEQAGTLFELSPPTEPGGTWTETTLYTFLYSQLQNGVGPAAGMVRDGSGNLYGTTWLGGNGAGGVVFELSPPGQPGGTWTYSVLYDFFGTERWLLARGAADYGCGRQSLWHHRIGRQRRMRGRMRDCVQAGTADAAGRDVDGDDLRARSPGRFPGTGVQREE